ncbi:MAG: hypothetical protein GXY20_03205 [Clostridiales bacterium]|nr:hypothetical protein [Clostridiales bacterium]
MRTTAAKSKKEKKSKREIRLVISLGILIFSALFRLLSPALAAKAGKVIVPIIDGDTDFEAVFRSVGSFAREKAGSVFSFLSDRNENKRNNDGSLPETVIKEGKQTEKGFEDE